VSVFVDASTRVLVQGITGREGAFHARHMLDFGTPVVAGVTPGKGGQSIHDVPVFNTVREACAETGANATVIYVPAAFARDAIFEAFDAGMGTVIVITEGVPVHDMLGVVDYLDGHGVLLVGPNCPGLIEPAQRQKLGIIPGHIVAPGPVGVVSRSGTLTYEVLAALTARGIGQSAAVGIGGDPVQGTKFIDCLARFERDPDTRLVVLIGEIGGSDEEAAADYIRANVRKPVVAFVAGQTAPPGRRMGHAGAIISGGHGTAAEKVTALERAGVQVARHPDEIADLVAARLG
jgi:succinyl-CoA synthetase alpha subunit